MRLRDIMSESVDTIPPDASVEKARMRMRQQQVRHLVVVQRDEIVGIVSEHDVRFADGAAPVRTIMSTEVVTAPPLMDLRKAANLLRGNHVGALPIVERGALIGMITRSDLIDLIGKGVTREPHGPQGRPWVPGR